MVGELIVWHGDTGQMMALMSAIEHNCTCRSLAPGAQCKAHTALFDQRFMDGLLFARWMRTRLIVEESRRVQ